MVRLRTAPRGVLLAVLLTGLFVPAAAASPVAAVRGPLSTLTAGSMRAATAASVVVAVVDTGVQADHPALAGRVLPGRDFVNGDGDAGDDNGHGTAIAGIVVAAEGASGTPGACAECRILPVKVLGADGTGDWNTIAAGIRWAADNGAQVINLSIGAPHVLDVVGSAVAYAISKGAIVVAAAGNDGANESFYPAAYPGVVSVAGVDANGGRYSWSDFGGWVTVAAPGCTTTAWVGGQYKSDFCGTSAAAPYVAGLAALALSLHPGLTPAAFAGALASSSTPLPDSSTAAAGRVDPSRLLAALGARGAPTSASSPSPPAPAAAAHPAATV